MLSALRKEDHNRIIIAAKKIQKNHECVGESYVLKINKNVTATAVTYQARYVARHI